MPAYFVLSVLAAGLYFSHADCEIACDNTGTCRAAGYSDEADERRVSVLLTRKAGPGQPVTGELKLGTYDQTSLSGLPKLVKLAMQVNDKPSGSVQVGKDEPLGQLSAEQVGNLLAALPRSSRIVFRHGNEQWRLSDKGAAAVLLKMDEFQRRIGTRGALLKPGAGSEDKVLQASAPPVVIAAKLPEVQTVQPWPAAKLKRLRKTLAASLKADDCEDLEAPGNEVTLQRLSPRHLLASARCFQAAYNSGSAFWVIEEAEPFKPVLATLDGSDFSGGRIIASHKGRGLGDCWSTDEWIWDGKQFVHAANATTGMCRLIAAGGPWLLPTLVTDVR